MSRTPIRGRWCGWRRGLVTTLPNRSCVVSSTFWTCPPISMLTLMYQVTTRLAAENRTPEDRRIRALQDNMPARSGAGCGSDDLGQPGFTPPSPRSATAITPACSAGCWTKAGGCCASVSSFNDQLPPATSRNTTTSSPPSGARHRALTCWQHSTPTDHAEAQQLIAQDRRRHIEL